MITVCSFHENCMIITYIYLSTYSVSIYFKSLINMLSQTNIKGRFNLCVSVLMCHALCYHSTNVTLQSKVYLLNSIIEI